MRFASCILFVLSACGGSDKNGGNSSFEIADQTLQGSIGGAAWTFMKGVTSASLSTQDHYFARFYATSTAACANLPANVNYIIASLPRTMGDYELGSAQMGGVTFVVDDAGQNQSNPTTNGVVRVSSVSATELVGGLRATFDANNTAEGNFTVEVCP